MDLTKGMTNDTLKVGDICFYSFGGENKSLAIVQIVRLLNDTRGVAEIKILKVIVDDTGNGFFDYLCETGKTMNASLKYLQNVTAYVCCSNDIEFDKYKSCSNRPPKTNFDRIKSLNVNEFVEELLLNVPDDNNTRYIFESWRNKHDIIAWLTSEVDCTWEDEDKCKNCPKNEIFEELLLNLQAKLTAMDEG